MSTKRAALVLLFTSGCLAAACVTSTPTPQPPEPAQPPAQTGSRPPASDTPPAPDTPPVPDTPNTGMPPPPFDPSAPPPVASGSPDAPPSGSSGGMSTQAVFPSDANSSAAGTAGDRQLRLVGAYRGFPNTSFPANASVIVYPSSEYRASRFGTVPRSDAPIVAGLCHFQENQQWAVAPHRTRSQNVELRVPGYDDGSLLCLTRFQPTADATRLQVRLQDCNGSVEQAWIAAGDGTLQPPDAVGGTRLCLQAPQGRSLHVNQPVTVVPCTGGAHQRWAVKEARRKLRTLIAILPSLMKEGGPGAQATQRQTVSMTDESVRLTKLATRELPRQIRALSNGELGLEYRVVSLEYSNTPVARWFPDEKDPSKGDYELDNRPGGVVDALRNTFPGYESYIFLVPAISLNADNNGMAIPFMRAGTPKAQPASLRDAKGRTLYPTFIRVNVRPDTHQQSSLVATMTHELIHQVLEWGGLATKSGQPVRPADSGSGLDVLNSLHDLCSTSSTDFVTAEAMCPNARYKDVFVDCMRDPDNASSASLTQLFTSTPASDLDLLLDKAHYVPLRTFTRPTGEAQLYCFHRILSGRVAALKPAYGEAFLDNQLRPAQFNPAAGFGDTVVPFTGEADQPRALSNGENLCLQFGRYTVGNAELPVEPSPGGSNPPPSNPPLSNPPPSNPPPSNPPPSNPPPATVPACQGDQPVPTARAGDVWQVHLFNADDVLTAQVGASTFTARYGENKVFLLGASAPGELLFKLQNQGGGYTYGFEVLLNSQPLCRTQAGQSGVQGANNNDTRTGTVLEQRVRFGGAPTPPPQQPPPVSTTIPPCSGEVAVKQLSPSETWDVRLFNVDDILTVEGRAGVFQAKYGENKVFPLGSSWPGVLLFKLYNSSGGYTYGFEVRQNGQVRCRSEAGQVGVRGAGNQTGKVLEQTVNVIYSSR